MGLALFSLSALSQPLHALAHWFQPASCRHSQPAMSTARTSSVYLEDASPRAVTGIATEPRLPSQQQSRTAGTAVSVSVSVRSHTDIRLQNAPCGSPGLGAASRHSTRRTVRVLHPASRSEVGRIVIAGRMADVCAELERMTACETWRH
jgi:hypothetical protein